MSADDDLKVNISQRGLTGKEKEYRFTTESLTLFSDPASLLLLGWLKLGLHVCQSFPEFKELFLTFSQLFLEFRLLRPGLFARLGQGLFILQAIATERNIISHRNRKRVLRRWISRMWLRCTFISVASCCFNSDTSFSSTSCFSSKRVTSAVQSYVWGEKTPNIV